MDKAAIIERIEARIERVPEGGCWLWTGGLAKAGYGVINLGTSNYHNVHKLMYQLLVGEVPEGAFVCHTCDNRCCVNPHHLYLGTEQTNTNDMRNRNRMAVGDSLPQAKLTEAMVREIRSLKGKEHRLTLASKYGVSPRAITHIWDDNTWTHIL